MPHPDFGAQAGSPPGPLAPLVLVPEASSAASCTHTAARAGVWGAGAADRAPLQNICCLAGCGDAKWQPRLPA